MSTEEERYHGVFYYDKAYYPETALKPFISSFLNGDIAPLIAEINKEQYNHIYFNIQNTQMTSSYVNSFVELFSQIPSVTYFNLGLNVDSVQAAQLATGLASSHIETFILESSNFSSEGMSGFIKAIADSKVIDLGIHGKLNDDVIGAMNFKIIDNLETLYLHDNDISNKGFSLLFDNLEDSAIKYLFIHGDFFDDGAQAIDAQTLANVNLSHTNIEVLDLYKIKFAEHALENLSFKDSAVEYLSIEGIHLSQDNLLGLSKALIDSNVKELILDLAFEKGDLAFLDLKGTPIEELSLHSSWYQWPEIKDDIANLDLAGSNVKKLNLCCNGLNDYDIQLLNFKNTVVEHILLDYNPITANGIAAIQEMIKDTHVKDVSFDNNNHQTGEIFKFLLINEYCLDNSNSLTAKQSKEEVILITDVLSDNALFDANVPVNTSQQAAASPLLHIDLPIIVDNSAAVLM